MKSWDLKFLEPSGPLSACNGTTLLFLPVFVDLHYNRIYLHPKTICYKHCFTVRLSYLWTYFVCVIKALRILLTSVMREVPESVRILPQSDREGLSDVDLVTSHMPLIGPIYVLFLRLSQFTMMADVYWSVEQSLALICEVDFFLGVFT